VFFGVALVLLLASLFLPPLMLMAGVFVLLGLVTSIRSPRLKRARYKHGVRGVVEEAVIYQLRSPKSPTVTPIQNYRIGGVMYRVEHAGQNAVPGQWVEFEFLDAGAKGRYPLFFRLEDQPRMAL